MTNQSDLSKLIYLFEILIESINEFDKEESDNIFLQMELEPWHHYYEMSKSHLLSIFLKTASLQPEALKYIYSKSPIDTAVEISKQDQPENPPNLDNLKSILSVLYAVLKNYESVLYHKRTIIQLLQKIKDGHDTNDNILQKLLLLDKTIINVPIVQSRLQKAQLNNDDKFFKKLSNALNPRKKPEPIEDAQLTIIIFLLMDHGYLQNMNEKERFELLEKYQSKYISDESFIRKIYKIMELYH